MTSFLKSSKFVLLAIPLSLTLSCSDASTHEDLPRDDIQKSEISAPYKSPVKPPMPEDARTALDCVSLAGWLEDHAEYLLSRGWCGHQNSDGSIQIDKDVVDLMDFSQPVSDWPRYPNNLKCLGIRLSNDDGGFAYIRSDGRAVFARFPYDNDCQPFGNGVFISYADGFAAYTDENLNIVKLTDYVLADAFYRNLSKVCRVMPEKKYHIDQEHFEWIGGQCGYIGTDYNVVEPIIHAYENTPRPTGGHYDGDEPYGIEAKMVETLKLKLPPSERLEAVFLKGGCNFRSDYTGSQCEEKYPEVPEHLYKKYHSISEFLLRAENQNYYRGLVVYYGGPKINGGEREFYWQSLEPMDGPSPE